MKVTGAGEAKSRKRLPTLINRSFKFGHSGSVLKHVVLIIQIINVIINMDKINKERLDEGSNLKLNKRFK